MKRKNKINYLLLLLFLMSIYTCEEAVDWELMPGENGQLVVDAILTNEITRQELRLTQSYSTMNGTAPLVSDAQVKVFNTQDTVRFSYQAEKGIYLSDRPFGARKNIWYQLEIEWQGKSYSAKSQLAKVFPFGEINFNPIGNSDSVTIANVGSLYHPVEQAMYELNLDWSAVIPSDSSRATLFFYTFNTIDVNELIRPPKENLVFPKGTQVIGQKYGLADDFAAYIRALVMETEWQGGVFDEASSSVPTNISNGGLGFFSVCGIRRDTVIVK